MLILATCSFYVSSLYSKFFVYPLLAISFELDIPTFNIINNLNDLLKNVTGQEFQLFGNNFWI